MGHARQRDIHRTDRSLREGRQASRCSVTRRSRWSMCAKGRQYLVKGKRVTGFTNAEEAVGLTAVVPFLLEDRLKERVASTAKQLGSLCPWTGGS